MAVSENKRPEMSEFTREAKTTRVLKKNAKALLSLHLSLFFGHAVHSSVCSSPPSVSQFYNRENCVPFWCAGQSSMNCALPDTCIRTVHCSCFSCVCVAHNSAKCKEAEAPPVSNRLLPCLPLHQRAFFFFFALENWNSTPECIFCRLETNPFDLLLLPHVLSRQPM